MFVSFNVLILSYVLHRLTKLTQCYVSLACPSARSA